MKNTRSKKLLACFLTALGLSMNSLNVSAKNGEIRANIADLFWCNSQKNSERKDIKNLVRKINSFVEEVRDNNNDNFIYEYNEICEDFHKILIKIRDNRKEQGYSVLYKNMTNNEKMKSLLDNIEYNRNCKSNIDIVDVFPEINNTKKSIEKRQKYIGYFSGEQYGEKNIYGNNLTVWSKDFAKALDKLSKLDLNLVSEEERQISEEERQNNKLDLNLVSEEERQNNKKENKKIIDTAIDSYKFSKAMPISQEGREILKKNFEFIFNNLEKEINDKTIDNKIKLIFDFSDFNKNKLCKVYDRNNFINNNNKFCTSDFFTFLPIYDASIRNKPIRFGSETESESLLNKKFNDNLKIFYNNILNGGKKLLNCNLKVSRNSLRDIFILDFQTTDDKKYSLSIGLKILNVFFEDLDSFFKDKNNVKEPKPIIALYSYSNNIALIIINDTIERINHERETSYKS